MAEQTQSTEIGDVNTNPTSTSPNLYSINQELDRGLNSFAASILKRATDAIDKTQRELDHFKSSNGETINKLKTDIVSFTEEKNKLESVISELKDKETKMLEIMGVFFVLFTFISMNVQIFSRITDLFSVVIFSSIIFCLSFILLIAFNILLRSNTNKLYILVQCIFIFILTYITYLSIVEISKNNLKLNPVENTNEFNEAVDRRIIEKVYDKTR